MARFSFPFAFYSKKTHDPIKGVQSVFFTYTLIAHCGNSIAVRRENVEIRKKSSSKLCKIMQNYEELSSLFDGNFEIMHGCGGDHLLFLKVNVFAMPPFAKMIYRQFLQIFISMRPTNPFCILFCSVR